MGGLDEFLAGVGDRLAERHSRRTLLGAVGAGLGASVLAGCGDDDGAGPSAGVPREAYGQGDVAVCYAPVRVLATEAEARRRDRTGVFVRQGPSFDAPIAVGNDGSPAFVPEGAHYGQQSRRRAPGPGCRPAAVRPAVNGFVWGYPGDEVKSNKSGWVPLEVGGVRYAERDDAYGTEKGDPKRWLCGPRTFDFDCRSEASKTPCGYRCSGRPIRSLDPQDRPRRVRDRGSVLANNNEEYYLRWALGSTPFWWIGPGDRLRELGTKKGKSYGKFVVSWSFVEVTSSPLSPPGVRGWLLSSVLEPLGAGAR